MKHITLILAGVMLAVGVSGASAERQLMDRIIAVVEDEAVFESDVEQMLRRFELENQRQLEGAERAQLRTKIIQDLINDKLVIAEAGRMDIEITFSEVEERVNAALDSNRQAFPSAAAFEAQLAREGFTIDSLKQLYREQIRNRMLVERVIGAKMSQYRNASNDDDLEAFLEEKRAEIGMRPDVVHLQTILLPIEASSAAQDASRARAAEARAKIQAGADFADVAKEYSQDPSAQIGGRLGSLDPNSLRDPDFADAIKSLEVGELSEPVKTSFGYHIIEVTEKDPDSNNVTVRHILVQIEGSDDDLQAVFARANAVREEIMTGAPFDSLALQLSVDPSANKGGDLGWLRVQDLPEFFREVLNAMSPGDVSQVMREPTGFRIVKLLGREGPRPYEFAEVRDQIQQLYEQERMGRAYEEYVAELREKFSVDIKQ